MRHDSECKRVKADESCFANLVVSEIKGKSGGGIKAEGGVLYYFFV